MPYIIAGIVIVILALAFVAGYNSLVRLRNYAKNAWSQIDVQLKRRWDLIPNLVESVKGYLAHEKGTLENITLARSAAMDASKKGAAASGAAEGALSRALGGLYVVMENYPDLKANQNVIALQEELTATENKISFARQFYNDTVMRYNTALEVIPSNFIGALFSFKREEYFELTDATERQVPKVSFS